MKTDDIQRLLAKAGYYRGKIDNDPGPKTKASVDRVLSSREEDLPKGASGWSQERRRVAAAQVILRYAGLADEVGKIDGYVGPSTLYALEVWNYEQENGRRPGNWRDDDVEQDVPADGVEPEEMRENEWPTQSRLTRFFGEPGGPQCTAGKVELPFPMLIAWNRGQKIRTFACHELVADSAERVYRKIASSYSQEAISRYGFDLFGGCYNFRKMRGGSSLSTHAYGIAIDHDPERNQLKWNRQRAMLANPEVDEFWRIWESEGWLSLGRARNYDWMHVQAARLT